MLAIEFIVDGAQALQFGLHVGARARCLTRAAFDFRKRRNPQGRRLQRVQIQLALLGRHRVLKRLLVLKIAPQLAFVRRKTR